MSNYIVEDEIDYDSYNALGPSIRRKGTFKLPQPKYLFIGGAILVVIIFIVIVSNRVNTLDKYQKMEQQMVENAQNYVDSNGINSNKKSYIDVGKMGMSLSKDCSLLSGVFYSDGVYEPYLICKGHRTKLENNNSISLVGDDVIFLKKGNAYHELGYLNVNDNISVSGTVNENIEGVYNIYYMSNNNSDMSIRKVVVIDNPILNSSFPIINLANKEDKIELGQQYNGIVTAHDPIDGNLTNSIIKINNINSNEVGTYNNVYIVTNSFGYTTMVSQNIIVLNSLEEEETSIFVSLLDENITNTSVKISVKIIGNNYDHLLLPDGTTSTEKEIIYEAQENGDYLFTAVNKDEEQISKTIRISTIDKTAPSGTCKAILYSTKTSVSVVITSFNRVVEYNYVIDNKESGYISTSYYNSNIAATSDVYVNVKDYVGNEGIIKCNSDKMYSYDSNGFRDAKTYAPGNKPRLYTPIITALSNKGHTVAELNKCIYDRVQTAGPGTRYGVVAAAYGLIDCTYNMTGMVLAYDHTGGKVVEGKTKSGASTNYCGKGGVNESICGKLGVNTSWGKNGGSCNSEQCYYGLNCALFVRWAMCNGGMDLCSKGADGAFSMVSSTYFPGADGVGILGNKVTYYSGTNLTKYSAKQLVRMIKPGDVIARSKINVAGSDHAFVVIGIDSSGIYTANDGYYVTKIKYDDMIDVGISYRILFLDKYYENAKNRNNLYN